MADVTFGRPYLWDALVGRELTHSQRVTASSRRPGKKFAGTVHVRPVEQSDVELCRCGSKAKRCSSCDELVCSAPGHALHVCTSREGEGAT